MLPKISTAFFPNPLKTLAFFPNARKKIEPVSTKKIPTGTVSRPSDPPTGTCRENLVPISAHFASKQPHLFPVKTTLFQPEGCHFAPVKQKMDKSVFQIRLPFDLQTETKLVKFLRCRQ
jgi:hypothetical protein